MDTQSLFGSVAVGKDASGNFKQSIYGLSVKTPDGKFIAMHKNDLVDVSSLTFDGTENLVYRVPVKRPAPKDILLRSDNPFSVLFVESVSHEGVVKGIDPFTGGIVEYKPITNQLGIHLFITVIGPDSFFAKKGNDEILPFLLMSGQGSSGGNGDALSSYLMMQSLGLEKSGDNCSMLALLLLNGQNGTGNNALSLFLAMRNRELFEDDKNE